MAARGSRHGLGHRLFMLGFIAAPFVVLAVLIQGILISFEKGPSMSAEPVGAGAGDTGGANAVGSSLFGSGEGPLGIPAEQAARGAELVVRDTSGRADPEHPILVLTNHGRWEMGEALAMSPEPGGVWRIRLPPPVAGEAEPLAFRFVISGGDGVPRHELDEAGTPVGPRRLPRVTEAEAVGEEPLTYTFTLERFEQ